MDGEPFKSCSSCSRVWQSREDFLADPAVELVGYQSFIQDEILGLFLFNHLACRTTLTVRAARFEDLHDGPIYRLRRRAAERGPGLCLARGEQAACPSACECEYVAGVVESIQRCSSSGGDAD